MITSVPPLLLSPYSRGKFSRKFLDNFNSRYRRGNLVPRAFSSFKMVVGETPGQGCWNAPRIGEYFVTWHMTKWLFPRLYPESGGPVCFLQSETVIQTKRRHFIVFAWWNSDELSDCHFERGEGPGDEVAGGVIFTRFLPSCRGCFQISSWK